MWLKNINISGLYVHRRLWYRGHGDSSYFLHPGVYREEFTKCTNKMYGKGHKEKRLNLEREMLNDFRSSGATLLGTDDKVQLYFLGQHYGIPTRLLDWTTNPLAALFFAVRSERNRDKDGDFFMMDALELLTRPPKNIKPQIFSSRNSYVTDDINVSFWSNSTGAEPRIVPIMPESRFGRIIQQSSCFTLHMYLSPDCHNSTLRRIKVPKKHKPAIRNELRRLNINELSIFNDLDHLSTSIMHDWGLQSHRH